MSKKNKNGAKSENIVEEVVSETVAGEVHNVEEVSRECVLESGIPIPAPQRANHKYPFNTMEPGQSFVFGKKTGRGSVSIAYWKKRMPGREFVSRTLQTNEIAELKEKGILSKEVSEACRIWRTDGLVVKAGE